MGIVTHERILCAVGRVLDLVDAQSFSIAETTDGGLRLDYIASTGVAQTLDLSLHDISDLIEWRPASADHQAGRAPAALRRLLAARERELELVGAR